MPNAHTVFGDKPNSMTTDKWANPQKMWDERFSEVEPVYGQAPNGFLRSEIFRLKPGMKVLVPGDGYGRNGIWLAQQGFEVHTVDWSPVGVARARKTAQAAGVRMTIEQADPSSWHWPLAEFDAFCGAQVQVVERSIGTVVAGHGAERRAEHLLGDAGVRDEANIVLGYLLRRVCGRIERRRIQSRVEIV